jgi:glutamate N-acetyltransferase / amino-acid N-acetyltransferase
VWYIFIDMKAIFDIIKDGGITSPKGFFAGATYAGIKKRGKGVMDLAVLYSEVSCNAAGVFTTNKVKAAPVLLDQQRLRESGKAQAAVINAGCANACTGKEGITNAKATAEALAKKMGINPDQVMVASTGVIGVQLPMDKMLDGISSIALSGDGGHDLARAIMTTDTRPKEIAVKVKVGKTEFTIAGVAKGAGMIHPNMATMLCFLTTDADVESQFLKTALKKAIDLSINLVTVDGDTSTNDSAIVLANGMANVKVQGTEIAEAFQKGLDQVCLHLAKSIARDGEGASRMIEVMVDGAASLADARLAAHAIANSPLVKTAVHGCDPNWGRIICAAGYSGAELDPEKADVFIDDIPLYKAGKPLPFDKKSAAARLDCDEVLLRMDFHLGKACATAWGCDLSEEYVVINSEYTT